MPKPRLLIAAALASILAQSAPATAQPTETRQRALAAGYKALFLCNGLFVARRTQAQVESEELARIYPEVRPIVPTLTAQIDPAAHLVRVPFAADMPPRIAVWRPVLGCAQLPAGAGEGAIPLLPQTDATPPPGNPDAAPWPMGDATPKPAPKLAAKLDPLLNQAFDAKTYGEGTATTGVLILQNDRILAERYAPGFDLHTPTRTWSVAKSITGALVGIARGQGLLDPAAPAPIPEWRTPGDPRAAITLDNLLHMASGLDSQQDGSRTDDIYLGGASVTERAATAPLEAKPGTRWKYANDDTLLAARALRAALNDDHRYLAYPFRELLWKIGMAHTTPETDWQGNYILSSQVWSTARDLARLGILFEHDGVWNGARILPEGWVRYMVTPAPAQPPGSDTGKTPGYGAQVWLHGQKQGLPEGSYAFEGNQGQYVLVIPARHVIIVRRGLDGTARTEGQFDIDRFAADILAQLP